MSADSVRGRVPDNADRRRRDRRTPKTQLNVIVWNTGLRFERPVPRETRLSVWREALRQVLTDTRRFASWITVSALPALDNGVMKFRLSAFGLHLLASALALTVTVGTLYAGWYHWPGWYLADVTAVFGIMVAVDLVLGPLLTLIVASPKKTRRALSRDVAVIAVVQLCALVYGTVALWNGRPLYYAFSVNCLSVVQAYDIEPEEMALARRLNAPLLPHWYSAPRWIWAPLPSDATEQDKIVRSAIQGGSDVISMPRYFKTWSEGIPALRDQLHKVEEIRFFTSKEKNELMERMHASGYDTNQPNGIAFTGRGRPLLAVFDPANLELKAIFKAT